jgi:hypothetical protein
MLALSGNWFVDWLKVETDFRIPSSALKAAPEDRQ